MVRANASISTLAAKKVDIQPILGVFSIEQNFNVDKTGLFSNFNLDKHTRAKTQQ